MESGSIVFSFFLIFAGAAVLASIALYTRQPLLIAYIVLGALIGPSGLAWIDDTQLLGDIAHIGIIFLLFLLGLDMQPSHLAHMLKKTSWIGIVSSMIFATIGFVTGLIFGFTMMESLIIGAAMMFSSTIIGIKLLPTTVLHHKHTGELVVSILLLQDLMAIMVLLFLYSNEGANPTLSLLLALIALPLLLVFAFVFVKYLLLPMMQKFDRFHEYLFLVAIGWCLGLAELAHSIGLSAEIGAFIAGVSIATSPIAQYIAVSLKPLRDFFLILFFFSVGASFNLALLGDVFLTALVLAVLALLLKPLIFKLCLQKSGEDDATSWEVGFRLGQTSEFSILIAYIAASVTLIGTQASHVIQATAILTFLLSSYIVVFNFKSPIAVSDKLRRD